MTVSPTASGAGGAGGGGGGNMTGVQASKSPRMVGSSEAPRSHSVVLSCRIPAARAHKAFATMTHPVRTHTTYARTHCRHTQHTPHTSHYTTHTHTTTQSYTHITHKRRDIAWLSMPRQV